MGLPKRLQGRLSPFLVAVTAAAVTGYDAATQHSNRTSVYWALFALSLLLVGASLLIKPNTK
jgi:hypothetical protein